jgi:alpha-tubulin suppressor-like RCC1 family protein
VLNFVAGQGVTNTASVPITAGVGTDLRLRNLGGTAHLLADVQGYWIPFEGSLYVPVTPCRLVDTRSGSPLGAAGARPLRIGGDGPGFTQQGGSAGGCTIPEDATAVEVSLTAVDVTGVGFSRLWPGDRTEPGAAALNFGPGQNTTNSGTVALSRSGLVDLAVRNYSPQSDYIVDVLGYYSPSPEWVPDAVSAGNSFACATFTDMGPLTFADLRCWGSNQFGQLGDDTTTTRRFPGPVTGITAVVDVDAGGSHACAVVDLAPNDQLRCWGRNDRGQVGKGDFLSPVDLPANVTLPFVPLDVEAGALHTCVPSALLPQDGSQLACWGENGSGQLGVGDTLDRFTPQVVDLAGAVAFDVATGTNHTCAVVTGGAVRCWGSNQFGQLGVSLGTTSSSTPLTVPGVVAERVVVGDAHTCVIVQSDQSVRCWGLGTSGQLGNGTTVDSAVPVTVVRATLAGDVPATGLQSLDAGGFHNCGVTREGSVDLGLCWGANLSGQLGGGVSLAPGYPQLVTVVDRVRQLSGGGDSTCAVAEDGGAWCFGDNSSGQLGRGTTSPFGTVNAAPVEVTGLGPI